MKIILLPLTMTLLHTTILAQSSQNIKDEVWQRELQYWQYVQKNDTASYNTLWHDNFIGYPESDSFIRKDKIANWITEVHNKKGLRYEFALDKTLVNPFDDVAIIYYVETDIWKNDKNQVVNTDVYRITHTWKKFGKDWYIIGGMSALKNQ